MTKKFLWFILIALLFSTLIYFLTRRRDETNPYQISIKTWAGFKETFISVAGRVARFKEADTVSEGQAYAMLRAVWLGDKKTFDSCYEWSERHLSRSGRYGDDLLAWHWKHGAVTDWMPASDADIDYALALIFADLRWKGLAPETLEDYGMKAWKGLSDILKLETYRADDGRLFLSPWILSESEKKARRLPVNPSYYSPAAFRIFADFTGDRRWLELVDTGYDVLESLVKEFDGKRGVGLIPDWAGVDRAGRFFPLEGKNPGYGWEAVRVPWRVAMDAVWFDSARAKDFFRSEFSNFFEREWRRQGAIFSEYQYDGVCVKPYENALFYSACRISLSMRGSSITAAVNKKSKAFIHRDGEVWFFRDRNDYYVNSLAWIADGVQGNVVRNLSEKMTRMRQT